MPFSEFLGNSHCVATLRRALERNRVPHALLFSGPDAVGKRLLARHLALALNCETGAADWCGKCPQCRLIGLGNHPDVSIVEPQGQFIKIEQVRRLIQEASFEPFQGKFRVFVIDEAHRLHPTAANALLKILEEPPPRSKIILITAQPHALLPTVRSRCQLLRFSPLSETEIETVLTERCGMETKEAARRARLAEGSVGRAIALDLKRHETYSKWAASFLELSVRGAAFSEASTLAGKVSAEREDTEEWLRQLFRALRGMLQEKVSQPDNAAESGSLTLPQLEAMAGAADELRRGLEHNVNRTLAIESLYLRFLSITGK